MPGHLGRGGSCIGPGWVGSSDGRRWAQACGWLRQDGSQQGWSSECFTCRLTGLSPSSSPPLRTSLATFLLPPCGLACQTCPIAFALCLAEVMRPSEGNKVPGHLVFPSTQRRISLSASRIQAVTFLWINSPVFFTRLCHCPRRCHLVCDLSGPELTPPDGRPPRAGR